LAIKDLAGMNRFATRLGAALFALAIALPSAARAQSADRVVMGYEISIAGFHVIDFDLTIAIDDRAYDVSTNFRTHGVFQWFVPWESASQSVGRVKNGKVKPERYEQIGIWRGNPRVVRFRYRDGAIGGIELVPSLDEDSNREPVTAAQMGDAQDPAAMLFALIRRVSAGEPCTGVVPVFDGRRRFDLEFVERGVEPIAAWRPGAFEGDARRCDFAFRIVAGFMRNPTDGPDRQREPRLGRAWLAPVVPGKPLAPVRIELDNSNWGSTVARLRPLDSATMTCVVPAPAPEIAVPLPQC
jgi:hypothetical protein